MRLSNKLLSVSPFDCLVLVAINDIESVSRRKFNPIDSPTMRIYFLLLGFIVSGQRLDLCQRAINSGRVKMGNKAAEFFWQVIYHWITFLNP